MDTKALENFCPWARIALIDAVKQRCQMFCLHDEGRTAHPKGSDIVGGHVLSPGEKDQRSILFERIEAHGYEAFCEEAAFSWFNRFAAIRYMELKGILPCGMRLLSSSDDGSFAPDGLLHADQLNLPGLDSHEVLELMAQGPEEELMRKIVVAQCNELATCLPEVFAHVSDADALTLPNNLLGRGEGDVLYHLVADIPEEAWDDVEVLGWMYQFYNSELKAAYFDAKRKARPEDLAPATQLFTPDWIVRYMVDNSLGRLWMLNNPESALTSRTDEGLMEYYIAPDAEHEDFIRVSSPEEITFCDPACGSGHILVYAFKLLFAMYEERGYRKRDIPGLILTKNLSGFEIDRRAVQIATLALAMRACEYDKRFLTRGVTARIQLVESVELDSASIPVALADRGDLVETLAHLSEVGSLFAPSDEDLSAIGRALAQVSGDGLFGAAVREQLLKAQRQCDLLSQRYTCVVANPPYMGSSSFNPFMSTWVKKHYPDVKSDLCTCFMVRILSMLTQSGHAGITGTNSWMFLSSYEHLRNTIIDEHGIATLIQLSVHGFKGIAAQVCTAVFTQSHTVGVRGSYIRLNDFDHHTLQASKSLEAIQNPTCSWFYRADATTFHDIPGSPIAFYFSDAVRNTFCSSPVKRYFSLQSGLTTGKNDYYMRKWWEPSQSRLSTTTDSCAQASKTTYKWFPCNKGGGYRKWYGNNEAVINWENNGEELRESKLPGTAIGDDSYYFHPSLTWGRITSSKLSMRYSPKGFIPEHACGVLLNDSNSPLGKWALALYNSSVSEIILEILAPTLNFTQGQVGLIPLITSSNETSTICNIVDSQISISIIDWDSQETSWDFKRHPLAQEIACLQTPV